MKRNALYRAPAAAAGIVAAALLVLPGVALSQKTLSVGLPTTPPNIVHMPIIVAQDLGLFKKNGIVVKTVQLDGGVKVFRAMVAGDLDIALAPATVTSIAISKGSKVKAVLATLYKFEASMVVRDNVKTMADLKGKRIGIQQPGGFADILSKSVLRAAKINPQEVHFVTIATEDVPALVANQVDTAILHVEQEMLAREKVPSLHAIARMWELQPKQVYNFLAVKEETIKKDRAAVQAFVKSIIEATRIIYTDRARVLPIMIKRTGYPEKIVADTYDFLVKECIWDANTGLSPERIKFTADLMTKVGNIEQGKTPSYDQIVDKSFAEKAIKELGLWKGSSCRTPIF
jgi:ABC-type nitrate/sulfonate/bicarbonate transport system substrate-binding protein